MRTFWRTLAVLLCFSKLALGTATDVSSSKNELLMKGSSPHLRFVDDSGNDYSLTVDGNVMRVLNLDASNDFFNLPPTGSLGVELSAPTNPAVVAQAGGTLPAGTFFFEVTALDGLGETVPSSEVSCTTSGTCPGAGNCKCHVSWTAVSPPASSYRVYMGTGSGLEDHYDTVLSPTVVYDAVASPLPTPGTPPDATTAYSTRMAFDGVHFPDGSVQSTAGGSSAWQVSATHILSAQAGNVGIGNGSVFTPDAKLTVLGKVDINDMGAIQALATNNFQFISNYKTSTDRLWNTGQSSWAAHAGDGGDTFAVYHAPATAGAPVFTKFAGITTSGATFGPNTTTTGAFTFQGSNTDVNISAGVAGTASLNFNISGGKGFVITADGVNSQIDFSGTLSFHTPVGGGLVASISSTGAGFFNGGLSTNGSITSVGDIVSSAGRLRGAMSRACAVNSFTIQAAGSSDVGPPTSITAGGNNRVEVIATFVGYWHTQNADQKIFTPSLERDAASTIDAGSTMNNNPTVATTQEVPLSFSLQSIDLPVAGAHTYNVRIVTSAGTFNANNFFTGVVRVCAHEIP